MIVGLPASPSIVWYQTPAIVGKRPIDPTLPNAHTGPGPTLQRRQCSIYALANDEPTANELPLAKTNLSRSIWTIDHIYPVAARGFLDHLRRCPSDFDILTVGSFAGNTPVGDAETDVAVFVDMAHGQLDGQLQCQEAHECLFNIRKSVNRLPRLSDEYALVIVQLQQAVHVARVESQSMSAAFMGSDASMARDFADTPIAAKRPVPRRRVRRFICTSSWLMCAGPFHPIVRWLVPSEQGVSGAPVIRMVSLDINCCFVSVELSGQQLL
jgi:hypothetical protein